MQPGPWSWPRSYASPRRLLEEGTATALADLVSIGEWRSGPHHRAAVLRDFAAGAHAASVDHAPRTPEPATLRPWLLSAVHERLEARQDEFLTELRPVVALFVSFTGIDYDADESAGSKLDAFVRWVQSEAARAGGTVI